MPYIGDVIEMTTHDGLLMQFTAEDEQVIQAYGNFGSPPVNYQTRRGYKQSGSTEIDFTLDVRSMDITLFASPEPLDRAHYWLKRAELLNFFRPDRGGPIKLTIVQYPSGNQRSIYVRANGPVYPATDPAGDNFVIEEPLLLTAFDPIFFDPAQVSTVLSAISFSELVFPITFPITFAPQGSQFTTSVTYSGTWESYPTFVLTGPYTSATIENLTTGVSLTLLIPISDGETRTIVLTPGSQSITDSSGANKFSELSPESNLVDWNLRPDPLIAGGVQQIRATLIGGTANSGFEMQYYTRYFGI